MHSPDVAWSKCSGDKNKCMNGAVCTMSASGTNKYCDCLDDFVGTLCEISEQHLTYL